MTLKTTSKASVSPGTHRTKWLVRRSRHVDNSWIVAQHKKAQHLKPEKRRAKSCIVYILNISLKFNTRNLQFSLKKRPTGRSVRSKHTNPLILFHYNSLTWNRLSKVHYKHFNLLFPKAISIGRNYEGNGYGIIFGQLQKWKCLQCIQNYFISFPSAVFRHR